MGSAEERIAEFLNQRLRFLKWEYKTLESQSLSADEEEQKKEKKIFISSVIREITDLLRVSNPLIPDCDDQPICCVSPTPEEQQQRGRYLCVYFGFNVFFIDLNNKNIIDDTNQLVQIPDIQLLKKGFPVSMGMFKLDSDSHTYMIGGHRFPGYNHPPPHLLWDFSLFKFLYKAYRGVEKQRIYSCDTYHLSLANHTLTPCDFIGPLNKPKLWPIVERIGHKIHVFDSFPLALFGTYLDSEQIIYYKEPSHEVLDCRDIGRGWVEIPLVFSPGDKYQDLDEDGVGMMEKICNHIVVGDRIYARSHKVDKSYLVFESQFSKWTVYDYISECETIHPSTGHDHHELRINHVSQILQYNGRARCFSKSAKYGGLYVLIALFPDQDMKMIGRAYLVTGSGQILCFQTLPDIFEDFGQTFEGREATLINVDEHTMFAIVHGWTAKSRKHFLLISSFSVEEVWNDDIDVESPSEDVAEKVFVKVEVKDVYAYKKDMVPDSYYTQYACVSACVL